MSGKPLNQRGMTLIELVVAMGIAGFVVAGAAAVIFQLVTVSARSSDYMTAYTEVQNAGFSVSRDALQAEEVSVVDDPETLEIELLTLDWIDWEGDAHQVVYTLEDDSGGLKELWRTYSIDGVTQETIRVARYIDLGTSSSWDENVLTLVVTAQVGDETATRTYNVEPRPLS